VAMRAPGGVVAAEAGAGAAPAELRRDGALVGRISFEHFRRRRWRAVVTLAPTAPVRLDLPAMAAGPWGLEVAVPRWPAEAAARIHVRIQRDDRNVRTGARPSWFRDEAAPQYGPDGAPATADPPPPARLRRSGNLNGIATGRTTLVVAGLVDRSGRAAPYSDAGEPGGSPAVSVSAPSDQSARRPGLVAAGTRSGGVSNQRGTSSAAPLAARHLAAAFRQAPPPPGAAPDNYAGLLAPRARPDLPGAGDGPDSAHRLGALRLPKG
jgi:hypothetical protein